MTLRGELFGQGRGKVLVFCWLGWVLHGSGPFAAESPDLVVRFAEGYRASWTTAVGGVPADLFEDNVKRWSGDHIVDPALVPGVLLMNRPFRSEGARLVDLAPTILAALGAPRGPAMEGEGLLS